MDIFFVHTPFQPHKPGDYPLSPYVSIGLKSFSEENGQILLTANLMTTAEIDCAVERLVGEIRKCGGAMKRKLQELQPFQSEPKRG